MNEKITITEVGPRDGLQFESKLMPIHKKIDLIVDLIAAGLKKIQVVSFVNPAIIPQMADAEALVKRLPKTTGVEYSALVLNARGVERAAAAGLKAVEVSISASEIHSRQNSNMTIEEAIEQAAIMIEIAHTHSMTVRAGIQCVFGHPQEKEIPLDRIETIVEHFLKNGAEMLCLSDTTGMAHPHDIEHLLTEIGPQVGDLDIAFHLHDTQGLGLVNVNTALAYGIRQFDASLAGMGGCPFVPGAAGNIATEDLVNLLEGMSFETGIDIKKLSACSRGLESFFEKRFSGRMHRLVL